MFWMRLEYRLCHEFEGLPERRHQFLWCDGLDPEAYELNPGPDDPDQRARIHGLAWIGWRGADVREWRFTLLLPHGSPRSRGAIDWQALLPPDDMTCWISFDEKERYLEIEPGVARPDLP
ncbi:MAG TPA: hypothetical protein VD997_04025 [Phycisphaerales bacterium]|nr:hypothetical protein [Phycisphaerales bacterium]